MYMSVASQGLHFAEK